MSLVVLKHLLNIVLSAFLESKWALADDLAAIFLILSPMTVLFIATVVVAVGGALCTPLPIIFLGFGA